jgi:hypothetical protein
LQKLADDSGGFYRNAPDEAELNTIYNDIALHLQTEASVDTTAVMDFHSLTVNNATLPGKDVFTYIPDLTPVQAPGSTWIHKFNKTHGDSINHTVNQEPEWLATQTLTFNDIGTIHVNETWETTFRFKLLTTGNIELFGNTSCIQFNDPMATGIKELCLPNTTLIGQPNWTGTFTTQTIKLNNLRSTATGELTNELPLSWDTAYTGNATVTEQLYYMQNGAGGWVKFGEISGIKKGVTASNAVLLITSLPPGGYQIKVYATASDAPDDTITLSDAITLGGAGKYYIKLE